MEKECYHWEKFISRLRRNFLSLYSPFWTISKQSQKWSIQSVEGFTIGLRIYPKISKQYRNLKKFLHSLISTILDTSSRFNRRKSTESSKLITLRVTSTSSTGTGSWEISEMSIKERYARYSRCLSLTKNWSTLFQEIWFISTYKPTKSSTLSSLKTSTPELSVKVLSNSMNFSTASSLMIAEQ